MKVATIPTGRTVARSLKVLVPLIQQDLQQAVSAGMRYYIAAGQKLIEAKPQVRPRVWPSWCKRYFRISKEQARRYMVAAEAYENEGQSGSILESSLTALTGENVAQRERRQRLSKAITQPLQGVDTDALKRERQTVASEIDLHRELALELVDIGFKALATRLHPDRRGGSREAMVRLNRVRDELREVAETRRFV